MDLNKLASGAISAVNPMTMVRVYPSTGYDIGPGGRQVPRYGEHFDLFAQVQEFTSTDLRKLDGLNVQGARFSVFLQGQWNGAVRVAAKGGDLMRFRGQLWLVTAILTEYPEWTKCAVTLQNEPKKDVGDAAAIGQEEHRSQHLD